MQRSSSGSRKGVNAMVHTLKSMKALTERKRSRKQFESFFSDEFYKDYPDATTVEIGKAFDNNIAWGKGNKLGGTPTEIMKNVNLSEAIKGFEERQAHIAKSKLLSVAAPAVPAIPVAVPVAPVVPASVPAKAVPVAPVVPASVPAKAAPKAVPAPAPPPPPAPKKAPPPPPAPGAPPPAVAGAPPPIPPPGIFPIKQKKFEEDHKEENQLKKITRHNVEKIDDSVKVKPSSTVMPTIEASDIRRALAKSNNRRFKIGTNVIKYHRLNGIGKTATDFI